MALRRELVEVGTRVAYEDAANPRREGRVVAIYDDGRDYGVEWDEGYRFDDVAATTSDLRQSGWTLIADLPGNPFDGADVISIYTRIDAIRDGVLVPALDLTPDEPLFVRQAGWAAHVDLTAAVAALVTPTAREADERGQDVKGRLWDLLNMARTYRPAGADAWTFPCIFQLAGPERARWTKRAASKMLRLKVVLDEEPGHGRVATFMFPEES